MPCQWRPRPGGLQPAQPALLSQGSPDDNKMRFVYLINQDPMASPFNPFTHTCPRLEIRPPYSRGTFFFFGSLFQKIKEIKRKRKKKSWEAAPRVRELNLAERSKVEAGVVYCFNPSVLSNLCKQGCPIPTREAIMPLFTEAVAPHCPHQWGWWIDVWVWYLIKPAQLHNRGTCLAPNATLAHACCRPKYLLGLWRVTWSWHDTPQWLTVVKM